MEIIYRRGQDRYLVEEEGTFYLVDMKHHQYIESDTIDEFLRFGYFTRLKKKEQTEELEEEVQWVLDEGHKVVTESG